ncbi:hypothetical protein OG900_09490 [Streptomyces sp. NBC_00433]
MVGDVLEGVQVWDGGDGCGLGVAFRTPAEQHVGQGGRDEDAAVGLAAVRVGPRLSELQSGTATSHAKPQPIPPSPTPARSTNS